MTIVKRIAFGLANIVQIIGILFALSVIGALIYFGWAIYSSFSETSSPRIISSDSRSLHKNKSIDSISKKNDDSLSKSFNRHIKFSNTIACNEQKITGEVQDSLDHPGNLSITHFNELIEIGQCIPLSSSIRINVLREEYFTTLAV